jgi:hypothetical protein
MQEVATMHTPTMHVPPPPPFPPMNEAPIMLQPAMMQAPVILQPPQQPQLSISNVPNSISVRWNSIGTSASSYVVEVLESTSSTSNRFACQSPANGSTSLELCIQGLEAGRSFFACIRSVAQDGFESAPSAWSQPLTLVQTCNNQALPHMSSPVGQQPPLSPHSLLKVQKSHEAEKVGMVVGCPPPEITGHEDVALFLD